MLRAFSRKITECIRRLKLRSISANSGNASDCRRLLDAIESSLLCEFPSTWSARGMLPNVRPGITNMGPDYRFYNPFTALYQYVRRNHRDSWHRLSTSGGITDRLELRRNLRRICRFQCEPRPDTSVVEWVGRQ